MNCKKIVQGLIIVLALFTSTAFAQKLSSAAFYYGANPPANELRAYQAVIVEPSKGLNPKAFNTQTSEAFAYVSIGEASKDEPYFYQIPKKWFIAQNPVWRSSVLDQTNPKWREFFLNKIITPLWNKGYRGFFLDTMDSFNLGAKTPEARAAQEKGLVTLIKSIKAKYPNAKLILNRGFEVLPQIHNLVYGVAAESLFSRWNETKKIYQPVPKQDRDWLLAKLNQVKNEWHIPVISIDYVNPKNRTKAEDVVHKIEKLGFIPWVTNGSLDAMGYGAVKIVPRKILIYYNEQGIETIEDAPGLMYLGAPLEHFGYVPIMHSASAKVPSISSLKQYAAVILWLPNGQLAEHSALQSWLIKAKETGKPILIIGSIGPNLSPNFKRAFGLSIQAAQDPAPKSKIVYQAKNIGYETKPLASAFSFFPIKASSADVLLRLKSTTGKTADAIAITKWGGYILDPYAVMQITDDINRWIVNPITFLPKVLKLQKMPVPDTTTENGRRIMLAHIDGDAFVSQAEWYKAPIAAKVIFDKILKVYKIPTTVSVVIGEIGKNGLYKQNAPAYQKLAKEIFALPWVEVASHSWSHPFNWHAMETGKNTPEDNLPLPGYKFNLNTEITGSVDYIDKYFTTKNKPCKVFLWTGRTNASGKAVALTYKDGLANMNGGNTTITNTNKSLTNISPLGAYKDGYFQVFAPIQNENIYTNLWAGPYYGFRRVVETFKLTDKPIRWKPIDIYYHFYSGTKRASLKALEKVYNWTLKQSVFHMFVSDYFHLANDYNDTAITKQGNAWLIHTKGYLRELRVPKSMGYPDLAHSQNIIGFNAYNDSYYIHLGPAHSSLLVFTKKKPREIYLDSANAWVTEFNRTAKGIDFKLKGYMPITFKLANAKRCTLTENGQTLKGKSIGSGVMEYKLKGTQSAILKAEC